MRLEKKVALITGGYGGMGRASARLFAREGATVFVAGRNQDRGDALVEEINGAGGKARFVELDVVNQDQWNAAVVQVKEQAGALHVLMNIVGSNAMVRFPSVDIEQWNKIFEINVTGTLRGIQTCAPLIKENRYPLNQLGSAFINMMAWPFYLVPVFFPDRIWLGLAPVLFGMIGRLIVHGLLNNVKLKTFYNPGLCAVIFGHVPLGIWYLVEVYKHHLIHWWDWTAALAACMLFAVVIMRLIGFGLLSRHNSTNPFTSKEMTRWSRVQRLRHAGVTPGKLPDVNEN
ncbi:MAG: SDR family NAD(P)-dependent oxidoreductase [Terracidiphilus sp.]